MDIRKAINGGYVILERLDSKHYELLKELAKSKEIWNYMMLDCSIEATFDLWFNKTLSDNKINDICTLIIKDKYKTYIGTVALKNYSENNGKVETGSLWIGREFWGKKEIIPIKLEIALLLYTYCFEELKVNKIEFRVDCRNKISQNMILRLGAKYDGNLREDVKVKGVYSDSLIYSILSSEWKSVKNNLNTKLNLYKIPPRSPKSPDFDVV